MPSGKNRVPMAQLREALANDGFNNPRTYIQSGNALVNTRLGPKAIEEHVKALIKKMIGPDLAVVVRTPAQIEKMLKGNPFTAQETPRVFYTFFGGRPNNKGMADVIARDLSPNKVVFAPGGAYLYIPGSAARSKLSNNFLEKKLGVAATTRNANTLRALLAMAAEAHRSS